MLEEHLKDVDADVSLVIKTIAALSSTIRMEFPMRTDAISSKNVYGETQEALDVWTNDVILEKLKHLDCIRTLASEELPDIITVSDSGSLSVAFDPLDGSSNIKTNNIFGTIVGIYKGDLPASGRNIVASFYIIYGPITSLVYSAGNGVHEFVLQNNRFALNKENMKLPEPGKVYGVGENPLKWPKAFKEFVGSMESAGMKLRYGGALVGDFNQVLNYGGFFGYPGTGKRPDGKLRLLFECNPIAFIIENAGGASSNGKQSVLDVEPKGVDQRAPFYVGNKDLVKKLESML